MSSLLGNRGLWTLVANTQFFPSAVQLLILVASLFYASPTRLVIFFRDILIIFEFSFDFFVAAATDAQFDAHYPKQEPDNKNYNVKSYHVDHQVLAS